MISKVKREKNQFIGNWESLQKVLCMGRIIFILPYWGLDECTPKVHMQRPGHSESSSGWCCGILRNRT
jgi:hypothetical protein